MFCSVPTTTKSSKWLHRLRSSRGFPESDHIDLEHFLSSSHEKNDPQTCTDSALTDKTHEKFVADNRDDSGAIEGRDLITNVLSELFCMGDFQDLSRIRRKKSCRKQQSPRICVVSANSDVQNVPDRKVTVSSPSPIPLPLTLSSRRKAKEVNRESNLAERAEEEGDWEFSAYSQTEVTVIDTSVPCWKFEKMLYRRKNIWKIGDRKGKGLITGDRKNSKRKESLNENGDVQQKKLKLCSSFKSRDAEENGEKKKMKKKKKKLKLCNSLNYVDKEGAIVRLKSTQGHDQSKARVLLQPLKRKETGQL